MKKYESIIIVKPNLIKEKEKEILNKVSNKIGEFANIINMEDIGVKKLAYEIQKNKEGHYVVYQFEIDKNNSSNAMAEIERFYRITDEIIKFITVRMD
jgi:small subunit ribosomal protein S6